MGKYTRTSVVGFLTVILVTDFIHGEERDCENSRKPRYSFYTRPQENNNIGCNTTWVC